ncbi:hypothetical protein G6F56_012521 [Rhizopus delemar]|nr:hypothetical protein G6F56_012521 [Rhizopus delemar]
MDIDNPMFMENTMFMGNTMDIDDAMDVDPPEFYNSVVLDQRRYAYVAPSRLHRYRASPLLLSTNLSIKFTSIVINGQMKYS